MKLGNNCCEPFFKAPEDKSKVSIPGLQRLCPLWVEKARKPWLNKTVRPTEDVQLRPYLSQPVPLLSSGENAGPQFILGYAGKDPFSGSFKFRKWRLCSSATFEGVLELGQPCRFLSELDEAHVNVTHRRFVLALSKVTLHLSKRFPWALYLVDTWKKV